MNRKTWVKIKRGLLEPKHRQRLGVAVWLYLHILDRADWEQGAVLEWRDQDAADELGMSLPTVRNQRRHLEEHGYIDSQQNQYGQRIVINNWTNPREYSGEVHNPKTDPGQGDKKLTPSKPQGVNQGDSQGDSQGDNQGAIKLNTPTYSSQSHTSQNQDSPSIKSRRSQENHAPPNRAAAAFEQLRTLGMGGKTAHELASLEHVTLDYVKAHIKAWHKEKKPVGILVARLRDGDPQPDLPASEDRYRYVTGEFADSIEH